MIFKYTLRAAVVALFLTLMPNVALAQGYIGGGVGITSSDVNADDLSDFVVNPGVDDQDIGYFVYGGGMLNEHVGLEGFYADLGSYDLTSSSTTIYTADVTTLGAALRFVSDANPAGGRFFARVGAHSWDADLSPTSDCVVVNTGAACPSASDDGTGFLLGVGGMFGRNNGNFVFGIDHYADADITLAYIGSQTFLTPRN